MGCVAQTKSLGAFVTISNKTANIGAHIIVHDAVIFVGGAGDDSIGHIMRIVHRRYITAYRNFYNSPHDVWYSTYDGGKQIAKIIRAYKNKGKKVAIIGHSWGGAESAILLTTNQALNVDILITLDPVNKKQKPVRTKNISVWHNVYVDYPKSQPADPKPNLIARAGNPWEIVPGATSNDSDWMAGHPEYDHADAVQMFFYPKNFDIFYSAMK